MFEVINMESGESAGIFDNVTAAVKWARTAKGCGHGWVARIVSSGKILSINEKRGRKLEADVHAYNDVISITGVAPHRPLWKVKL